jgi:hypothetical protein
MIFICVCTKEQFNIRQIIHFLHQTTSLGRVHLIILEVLKRYITNNLEMTSNTMYFNMSTGNITIDGQTNTVNNINSVTNYPGLVRNGLVQSYGYNNITIKNLGVTTTNGSTLSYTGGWIGQEYMNNAASGCEIINCYSTGVISGQYAGGIFGYLSIGTA